MKIKGAVCQTAVLLLLCAGCATIPVKQYYVLNYVPQGITGRLHEGPYPYALRLKELDIEEAYNRAQFVYRQSPYELQYYVYRVWAVKPTRMITDLVYKHLLSTNLVSTIVRRYEEGPTVDFELSGNIEALEEYDSKELWFAHIAVRFNLTRISDGASVYTRRFDLRKRVYQHEPEYVIREMSATLEYVMDQVVHDLDVRLAKEYGAAGQNAEIDTAAVADTLSGPMEVPEK